MENRMLKYNFYAKLALEEELVELRHRIYKLTEKEKENSNLIDKLRIEKKRLTLKMGRIAKSPLLSIKYASSYFERHPEISGMTTEVLRENFEHNKIVRME